jgi:peptidyl-prolyl cis-trans isomerase D
MQHVSDAYAGSHFMPRTVAELLVRLSEQQREVSQSVIPADRFVAQVKLEPDAAKRYYDGNQDEFRVPEQVRIEYVLLSVESLLPQIQVSPAEVRKYYDEHLGQFESKESRRASHILIAVEPGADAAARQKARARAEQLYAQLQQDPGRFAELAKQHSQDPGSAAKGGDLGFFSRGALVKPFEDAVFAMKPGELSPPVETQYGYHLIRLTAVQPAKGRGFEEVRPQIEAELKKQLAGRKFAETAEAFNNAAFEQSDSLKPAAEIAKSPLRQSGWLSRSGGAEDARLNNPRLLQAVFSEDVLRNKRNTEAVEIAPGVLAAARILEHKPASVQPFEQVRAAIEKKLVLARAGQLAAQEGRQRLEALRQGKEAQVAWGAPQLVSRADAKGLAEPVARQVFRADVASLPAYAGVELPQGGYVLLRISRVIEPDKVTPEKRKAVAESLQQVLGQEQFAAYVASLRQKGGVKISKELIEKK